MDVHAQRLHAEHDRLGCAGHVACGLRPDLGSRPLRHLAQGQDRLGRVVDIRGEQAAPDQFLDHELQGQLGGTGGAGQPLRLGEVPVDGAQCVLHLVPGQDQGAAGIVAAGEDAGGDLVGGAARFQVALGTPGPPKRVLGQPLLASLIAASGQSGRLQAAGADGEEIDAGEQQDRTEIEGGGPDEVQQQQQTCAAEEHLPHHHVPTNLQQQVGAQGQLGPGQGARLRVDRRDVGRGRRIRVLHGATSKVFKGEPYPAWPTYIVAR